MAIHNPFPESEQKAFLRRYHLKNYLAPYREQVGRPLKYFGLPSAEMYDVALWARVLGHVTAVERDFTTCLHMYRTAQRLGVRSRFTLLEMDLSEATRLLALDEREAELFLPSLTAPMARDIRKARSIGYDVVNIDMCGGFLYPNSTRSESAYEQMLRQLISFQARQQTSFILFVTFNTRDAGRNEYDKFITETLRFLQSSGADTADLERFYKAKTIPGQPPNLRRLRFCLPTYLHKVSYERFEVQGLNAWYYKTFYHTALFFALREATGVLGPWPPVDEVKDLLNTKLDRVLVKQDGSISLEELIAPFVN